MRWRVSMRLPHDTRRAIEAVDDLQAQMQAATEAAIPAASPSPSAPPTSVASVALGGDAIATLELARSAPSACRSWVLFAAVGAATIMLVHLDPSGCMLLLLCFSALGALLLGVVYLLPPPLGIGQVGWVALGAAVLVHAPTFALQGVVARMATFGGGQDGKGNELATIAIIAPPLIRSSATAILALSPLPLFAPLGYLRSLGLFLIVTIALSAAAAVIVIPLLHVALRRPPPPPPPPPPRDPKRRHRGGQSAYPLGVIGRLLPPGRAARVPSYGGTASVGGGGSCLGSWQEEGTLPGLGSAQSV
jgi:hypothetical protein